MMRILNACHLWYDRVTFIRFGAVSDVFEYEMWGKRMIQVEQISKDFKKVVKQTGLLGSVKALLHAQTVVTHAVHNVTFHADEGEVLGFIGPNGAGKSTMIKMLTGILTPTSGFCRINGRIPQEDRRRYVKEIGVVFGQRTQLWWDLPLVETYGVLKEIYEVDDAAFKRRMAFLDDVLDLHTFIKSPVRTLSLGQRMRADIAASLLHSPKVLFLDEPTIGLDVVVKDNIRKAIREINQAEHTTVILTTHDLSDIEQLCRHIVMIDKGSLTYDGSLRALKQRYGQIREFVFVPDGDVPPELMESGQLARRFGAPESDVKATRDEAGVHIQFNTEKIPAGGLVAYILSKLRVSDMSMKDADIEEIIRRIYRDSARSGEEAHA